MLRYTHAEAKIRMKNPTVTYKRKDLSLSLPFTKNCAQSPAKGITRRSRYIGILEPTIDKITNPPANHSIHNLSKEENVCFLTTEKYPMPINDQGRKIGIKNIK